MSGGVSGDFRLPPQLQSQPQPEFDEEGNPKVLGEAAAEGQVQEQEDSSETRAGKKTKSSETSKSEKSTATNEAGDVVIAGVGGTGSDTSGGGSGGGHGDRNPDQPELGAVGEISANVSLEEVTSAFIAALFALTMSEVAQSKADYAAGDSMLNSVYRSLDATIDQTNSAIMRNKLEEAKEKRIEAEKKAKTTSIIFAVVMMVAVIAVALLLLAVAPLLIALAPVMLAAQLAACGMLVAAPMMLALEASGGMQEGGIMAGILNLFGAEDTMQNRMILYTVLFVVLTGPLIFVTGPLIAMRWGIEKDIEEDRQEARELMSPTLARNTATNTPAAIKETLEEMGVDGELSEIMAMLTALLMLLMMMLAGGAAGGAGAGAGAASGGTAGGTAGATAAGGKTESGESLESEQGLPEADASTPPPESSLMDEGLQDDFGSFDAGTQTQSTKNAPPPMTQQEIIDMSHNAAAQMDTAQVFQDLKGLLLESGYRPELVNDPALEQFVNDFGKELAEISITGPMLALEEVLPTITYLQSMFEQGVEETVAGSEKPESNTVQGANSSGMG